MEVGGEIEAAVVSPGAEGRGEEDVMPGAHDRRGEPRQRWGGRGPPKDWGGQEQPAAPLPDRGWPGAGGPAGPAPGPAAAEQENAATGGGDDAEPQAGAREAGDGDADARAGAPAG